MNEELLELVRGWTLEQLNLYISQLEERYRNLVRLMKELKAIQRSKQRKANRKNLDNGIRGGK
jgi:hypothetical protein